MGNTPDHPEFTSDMPGYVLVERIVVPIGLGAGGNAVADVEHEQALFPEHLILHELRASPEDVRYMALKGQSMEPVLQHDDQVLIDIRDSDISQAGLFVLWDGDGLVCKWVSRVHGSDPPKIRLLSENERFDTYEPLAEECKIMGRVVWFARRL